MAFDREAFTELLENSYTAYYNIIKEDLPDNLPMVFRGDYFQRSESYWLTKKNIMYGNETNEYAYVFSTGNFDGELAQKCIQYALDDGLPRVKPHKEHQFTNIKTIFIADSYDDDAIDIIKKTKYSVSYHHSLWGYTNLLNSAVNVADEKIYTNRAGYEMKKYFKKLFSAQKK